MSKLDTKYGFWRMVRAEVQEWNFVYVLPNHHRKPTEIVVPSALQMGWVLSPPFFCAQSETARDVAASYVAGPQRALLGLPLGDLTMPEVFLLPLVTSMTRKKGKNFLHMLEVYVDNFIQLEQTDNKEALQRCSWELLHGIHSVFPPTAITGHVGEEPVSMRKLPEGEGQW